MSKRCMARRPGHAVPLPREHTSVSARPVCLALDEEPGRRHRRRISSLPPRRCGTGSALVELDVVPSVPDGLGGPAKSKYACPRCCALGVDVGRALPGGDRSLPTKLGAPLPLLSPNDSCRGCHSQSEVGRRVTAVDVQSAGRRRDVAVISKPLYCALPGWRADRAPRTAPAASW